jgi:signal transduction histidine kinase/CheY-like chemotaxis protein
MNTRLLMIAIAAETDIVLVRKRTRRLAELIGFDTQDQTRITTAVSEIARNAFEYANGGQIEFRLAGDKGRQKFAIGVRDRGPGIANLEAILAGFHKSATGMGIGLLGAQRLMDGFRIDTKPGEGTTVWLEKWLPTGCRLATPSSIKALAEALAADGPADAMAEIRQQNQQILVQMEELRSRHEELEGLNQELQDTNRGVVALYAELDERADHLRRADELKSKFLSHMSHEFRTPLNSIMALSRLLLDRVDGELTTEQETQVRYIRKAAENLTELVDDLLDLAKVEAGKTVVVASEFTAGSLFGALRGMLRPLLVGDAVALVFDDASDVPPLDTDEAKVSQILRNFISNAIKFTERGEVRVWATTDPVADTVAFHVRDTGIGIAATDLELIFQEFGQVSHRLQSRVKGTGLGLPLARKLAELLGGRITVSSTLGEGSTFSVTLPRSYPNSVGPADDAGEGWHLEPGKIPVLMVEDDPADAFTMERLLAGTDYQPVWARSIRQAQGILRRVEPAAFLLDVILAGDESWRLMLQLKQQEASADIPLIVTSSAGEQHKAHHLGADGYLPKPIDGKLLIELLDRVTGRQPTTKVLLIDDEDVTRYLVRQLLPRSGYSLCCANNGKEGIRLLHDQHPDVVLLDLKMPEMDGYEYLEQVHENATEAGLQLPDAPTIVLTSTVLEPGERTLLKRCAVTILPKSELSPDTLVGTIESVLRNGRAAVAS